MMCRKIRGVSFLIVLSFLLFLSPFYLISSDISSGNIAGTVYASDGTTPVQGAVIKIKHISADAQYQSAQSDDQGAFSIQGVQAGIYSFGVSTSQGDFNSSELIGVKANKTSTLTLTMEPFDEQTTDAAEDIYKELVKKGESEVGYVLEYDEETGHAVVYMTKGFLQINDRVKVKGEETDFKMNVKYLERDGKSVKKVFAGETITMELEHDAIPGDLVCVICKKGISPFFFIPVGIITGTGFVTTTDTNGGDEQTPFGKRK